MKPGGRVVLASCFAAIAHDDMVTFADMLGFPVLAYDHMTDLGAKGQGKGHWWTFKPGNVDGVREINIIWPPILVPK